MTKRLQKLVDESHAFIKKLDNQSNGYPLICNFSGGKDSQTMLSLILDVTDNVEALYMESTIDLPGSIDHVKTEIKKYGIKLHISNPVTHYEGDFSYFARKIGYFPATSYTWCSTRLKIRPARAYLRTIFDKAKLFKLNAVRRDESSRRQRIYPLSRGNLYPDNEHSGSMIAMPIINWSKDDVITFLRKRDIQISDNYKTCGVSGCYYCPFYQARLYHQINDTYPNIYEDIMTLEQELKKPSVIGNRFLYQLLNQPKLSSFFG